MSTFHYTVPVSSIEIQSFYRQYHEQFLSFLKQQSPRKGDILNVYCSDTSLGSALKFIYDGYKNLFLVCSRRTPLGDIEYILPRTFYPITDLPLGHCGIEYFYLDIEVIAPLIHTIYDPQGDEEDCVGEFSYNGEDYYIIKNCKTSTQFLNGMKSTTLFRLSGENIVTVVDL